MEVQAAERATLPPGLVWPKDRWVDADDGARITYTVLGADGPVVVLCSGFLCPDTWWYHLAPALVDHGYRVVVLHYRGIGPSTLPPGAGDEAVSIPRFAGDVLDVIAAEGIDEVALAGHSMGVQVMLDVARSIPDRVTAMAAVTGPFRSPLRDLYDRGELVTAALQPVVLTAGLLPASVVTRLWRAAWRHLPFLPLGRVTTAFGPRTPDDIVAGYVEHAATLPSTYVLRVLQAMRAHDAEPVLAHLDVPTVVVAGGRDPFTPPSVARRMVAAMPDAYLRIVPDATHGAVLEFPEVVNGWVLDHLEAHVGTRRAA